MKGKEKGGEKGGKKEGLSIFRVSVEFLVLDAKQWCLRCEVLGVSPTMEEKDRYVPPLLCDRGTKSTPPNAPLLLLLL